MENNNLEHLNNYQLNIDLDMLDAIYLLLSDQEVKLNDCSYLINALKHLLIADSTNILKDYKRALNYLERVNNIETNAKYTAIERMLFDKILENFKNKQIELIVSSIFNLKINLATYYLVKYIEKQ